jgi:hypothetical protein
MADFCSENKEVINESNYAHKYPKKSCLPNNGDGWASTSLNHDGLVQPQSLLDNHVVSLLSKSQFDAEAPVSIERSLTEVHSASKFAESAKHLRLSINDEYCFYYKRYMFALQNLLMKATSQGTNIAGQQYIQEKKQVEQLNSKLNQILQIMQALVNSRLASLKGYYSDKGVNLLNAELDKTRANLLQHSNRLKSASMETDVKQSMIDYTLEKNSSSRNLLAIYGFMNIVAVGLLFYLYRNSK